MPDALLILQAEVLKDARWQTRSPGRKKILGVIAFDPRGNRHNGWLRPYFDGWFLPRDICAGYRPLSGRALASLVTLGLVEKRRFGCPLSYAFWYCPWYRALPAEGFDLRVEREVRP